MQQSSQFRDMGRLASGKILRWTSVCRYLVEEVVMAKEVVFCCRLTIDPPVTTLACTEERS
jgi:hypothetical protein